VYSGGGYPKILLVGFMEILGMALDKESSNPLSPLGLALIKTTYKSVAEPSV